MFVSNSEDDVILYYYRINHYVTPMFSKTIKQWNWPKINDISYIRYIQLDEGRFTILQEGRATSTELFKLVDGNNATSERYYSGL